MYIVNTLVVLKLTGTGRIQIPLFSKGNSHCGCSFESLPSEICTHFSGTDYDLGLRVSWVRWFVIQNASFWEIVVISQYGSGARHWTSKVVGYSYGVVQ